MRISLFFFFMNSTIFHNRPYLYQISAMHYGSISGMLCNDISLRDSILLHVKDVSLKDIKRWVNGHLLNDVSSPIYYLYMYMLCEECNIDIVHSTKFLRRKSFRFNGIHWYTLREIALRNKVVFKTVMKS